MGDGHKKGSLTQASRERMEHGRESQGWDLAQPLLSPLPSSLTCGLSGAELRSSVSDVTS